MELSAVLSCATPRPWSVRPTAVLANDAGNVRFIADMRSHAASAGGLETQDCIDQSLLCHAVNTFETLYAALRKAEKALEPGSEVRADDALREIREARALAEKVTDQGRRR